MQVIYKIQFWPLFDTLINCTNMLISFSHKVNKVALFVLKVTLSYLWHGEVKGQGQATRLWCGSRVIWQALRLDRLQLPQLMKPSFPKWGPITHYGYRVRVDVVIHPPWGGFEPTIDLEQVHLLFYTVPVLSFKSLTLKRKKLWKILRQKYTVASMIQTLYRRPK